MIATNESRFKAGSPSTGWVQSAALAEGDYVRRSPSVPAIRGQSNPRRLHCPPRVGSNPQLHTSLGFRPFLGEVCSKPPNLLGCNTDVAEQIGFVGAGCPSTSFTITIATYMR